MEHTLILTKTSPPDVHFVKAIQKIGFTSLHCPVLSITYHAHPLNLEYVPTCLVVTSKHALHNIYLYGLDETIPILCVGKTTQRAIQDQGFSNIEHVFETGEGLVEFLQDESMPHQDILFLRGKDVQHDLSLSCKMKGIGYQEHIVYSSSFVEEIPQDIRSAIKSDHPLTLCVFSMKGALSLHDLIQKYALQKDMKGTNLLCMSERMLKSLDCFQWDNGYVSEAPTQISFLKSLALIQKNG